MILTEQNFKKEVLEADSPVLVDFWGAWCRPCYTLALTLNEIEENIKEVKIGKVNSDENPELMREYSINALPTLLFFNKGQLLGKLIGLQDKSTIVSKFEELFNILTVLPKEEN